MPPPKTPEAKARQIAHLKKGNRGKRRSTKVVDMGKFCLTFLRHDSRITPTAAELKVAKTTVYRYLKDPGFDSAMAKAREALLQETAKLTAKRFVLDRSHLDERLLRRLDGHKTHETRGDQDYYTGVKIGYQSLQLIEAPKVINNNSAQAGAQAGSNAFDVYEPAWLRQKKAEWDKQLEQKHGLSLPESTT